jgi:hypothetical protein
MSTLDYCSRLQSAQLKPSRKKIGCRPLGYFGVRQSDSSAALLCEQSVKIEIAEFGAILARLLLVL